MPATLVILADSIPLVFLIRFAERRVDKLLDSALLDYSPLPSDDSAQFELDWSFFRSAFSGRKKSAVALQPTTPPATLSPGRSPGSASPAKLSRPISPTGFQPGSSLSSTNSFASLSSTIARGRAQSATGTPRKGYSENHTPDDITSFLTALHALLSASGINPAFIMQLWSQTMYWTSCKLLALSY